MNFFWILLPRCSRRALGIYFQVKGSILLLLILTWMSVHLLWNFDQQLMIIPSVSWLREKNPTAKSTVFGVEACHQRKTVAFKDAASQCVCFHWFSFHLIDRNPAAPRRSHACHPRCLLLPQLQFEADRKLSWAENQHAHIYWVWASGKN